MVYLETLLASPTILRPTAYWVRNATVKVAAFEVLRRYPSVWVEQNLHQGSACPGDFPETGQQRQSVVTRLWCNRLYSRASKTRVTHVTRKCLMQQVKYLPPPPPNTIDSRTGQGGFGGGGCCLLVAANRQWKAHVIFLSTPHGI
jgi:hypothetical protein